MVREREIIAVITSISFFLVPYLSFPINLIFIVPLVLLLPGLLLTSSLNIGIIEKFALGSFISMVVNGVGFTVLAFLSLLSLSIVVLYLGIFSAVMYLLGVILEAPAKREVHLSLNRADLKAMCIFVPVILISATIVFFSISNNSSQEYIEFYMDSLGKLKQNEIYTINITVVSHYRESKYILIEFSITNDNRTEYFEFVEYVLSPSEVFVKKFYFRALDGIVIRAKLYIDGVYYDELKQIVRTYEK